MADGLAVTRLLHPTCTRNCMHSYTQLRRHRKTRLAASEGVRKPLFPWPHLTNTMSLSHSLSAHKLHSSQTLTCDPGPLKACQLGSWFSWCSPEGTCQCIVLIMRHSQQPGEQTHAGFCQEVLRQGCQSNTPVEAKSGNTRRDAPGMTKSSSVAPWTWVQHHDCALRTKNPATNMRSLIRITQCENHIYSPFNADVQTKAVLMRVATLRGERSNNT